MNLSDLTIKKIRKLLLLKKISACEIVQITLKNIEKYNPILNAWTEITSHRMIKEAKKIDNFLSSNNTINKLPSLIGIPYAVKNLFDVKGYVTKVGSKLFDSQPVASQDAWVINKLKLSGALLSGMLNMDAYAYGFTNENKCYGPTKNPHNISYISGGSSGGSAVAVASGLVNFSLGTDTNGSIRVPASLCGVFGLKPTFGRISKRGAYPFINSLDHVGHFARYTEDLAVVYDVLQGHDIKDPYQINQKNSPTLSKINKNNGKLRCAILTGFFTTWCDDEARNAVFQAAKGLDTAEEITLPQVELARAAAFIITATEAGNNYLPNIIKNPENFEPYVRDRLIAGTMIPSKWYLEAKKFRNYFYPYVLSLIKKFDILIAPATPCTAIPIGQKIININNHKISPIVGMGILTQPISFLGLPVCTVPFKSSHNGMPIGVQLIGQPFREDNVLRAAYLLEKKQLTYLKSSKITN